MTHVSIVVTGDVQGVGFRWHVQRAALALGLSGEVRNRRDGAVEIEAEGARVRLEELVAAAREGPAAAVVNGVDVTWSEGPPRHRGFRVAPSA